MFYFFFFFQAEDGIRDIGVTGVQTCALPIWAEVLAVDRSARRRKRLEENRARLGLTAQVRAVDAERLDEAPFDAILLDAPCSATGTIRRHPDVAWTKSEDDIRKLAGLQARLLDKAASLLKSGGRLIYCTCSLEAEEGERQAERSEERRGGKEGRSRGSPDHLKKKRATK